MKLLVIILFLNVISGCGYSQNSFLFFDIDSIKYDKSVPYDLANQIKRHSTNENNPRIRDVRIYDYEIESYDVFGGNYFASMEREFTISIKVDFDIDGKSYTKKISSIQRLNLNELNPLSEKESMNYALKVTHEDITKQIIIEASKIGMQSY